MSTRKPHLSGPGKSKRRHAPPPGHEIRKWKAGIWWEKMFNKNILEPIKGKQQVGVICLGGCISDFAIAENYIPLGLLPLPKDDHIELWLNDEKK